MGDFSSISEDPENLSENLDSQFNSRENNSVILDELEYREELNKVEAKEHELEIEKCMLQQRKRYALCLFYLILFWLIVIICFILLSGLKTVPFTHKSFLLSDAVVIALISTTTINVVGLFYIVARWLFPNKIKYLSNSER